MYVCQCVPSTPGEKYFTPQPSVFVCTFTNLLSRIYLLSFFRARVFAQVAQVIDMRDRDFSVSPVFSSDVIHASKKVILSAIASRDGYEKLGH